MTDSDDTKATRKHIVDLLKALTAQVESEDPDISFMVTYRKSLTPISDTQFVSNLETLAILPSNESASYRAAVLEFLDPVIAELDYQLVVKQTEPN